MKVFAIVLMAIVAIFTLFVSTSALYSVDESEYGLVLRFGEVRQVRTSPGLYIKAPFVDSLQRIDKRTLRADIPPREVPDQDKERLIIDMVVRYQIVDPVAFRRTLRNEHTALDRLQVIMYSALRDTIAQHDRTSLIGARAISDESGNVVNDEDGLPIYESLVGTRDRIGDEIHERVDEAVTSQSYGIDIISTHIKRADFPPQISNAIIDRMNSERQRVAAGHRAAGEEEYLQRTSAVQAEADILLAQARSNARKIRGEGDAEAIAIIQGAIQKDPQFYNFLRTLESYETALNPDATILLSDTPGGYLETLTNPPSAQR